MRRRGWVSRGSRPPMARCSSFCLLCARRPEVFWRFLVVFLRNKRPGLSGQPPCKGVAIWVARKGGRLSGERTLRIPPCCSLPVSHAGGGLHVASSVVGRPCVRAACVRASLAKRAAKKKRKTGRPKKRNINPEEENAACVLQDRGTQELGVFLCVRSDSGPVERRQAAGACACANCCASAGGRWWCVAMRALVVDSAERNA